MLADDHALVRGGLSLLIKTVDEEVEIIETSNFQETLSYLSGDTSIDLLLMDLLMPGMDGVAGIERIANTYPDVPIAIVSVKEDIRTIREALRAGAVGYIPKTSTPNVTKSAIQLILSGGIYVPPHVLRQDIADPFASSVEGSDFANRTRSDAKALGVTPRQKNVLDLLARGKSNKEIASHLGLTPGTVKMHTSRIFKTLNVSNRTEAVAKYTEMKRELGEP